MKDTTITPASAFSCICWARRESRDIVLAGSGSVSFGAACRKHCVACGELPCEQCHGQAAGLCSYCSGDHVQTASPCSLTLWEGTPTAQALSVVRMTLSKLLWIALCPNWKNTLGHRSFGFAHLGIAFTVLPFDGAARVAGERCGRLAASLRKASCTFVRATVLKVGFSTGKPQRSAASKVSRAEKRKRKAPTSHQGNN